MDSRPDEELVEASRGGEITAYEALVRRYSAHIFAVCLGILGNVSDSEDIAQETLVKALSKLDSLREGKQFASWVSQIARNLCRDLQRTRSRHRELLEKNQRNFVRKPNDYTDLREALEGLPEEHRLPLMLYYFDGEKTESVAEALSLSRAGACTRLCRARKALRKKLESDQ